MDIKPPCIADLREVVSGLMVRVHHIPATLADYHVAGMTQADLEFRIEMYGRMGVRASNERRSGHEKDHAPQSAGQM